MSRNYGKMFAYPLKLDGTALATPPIPTSLTEHFTFTVYRKRFQGKTEKIRPMNLNKPSYLSLSVADLVRITEGFLVFARSLNRPLHKGESDSLVWIYHLWEHCDRIRHDCAKLSQKDKDHICDLLEGVQAFFEREPQRMRVRRDHPRLHGHQFNRGFDLVFMEGVRGTDVNGDEIDPTNLLPLSEEEARQRIQSLKMLLSEARHVAKELACHRSYLSTVDKFSTVDSSISSLVADMEQPKINGNGVKH